MSAHANACSAAGPGVRTGTTGVLALALAVPAQAATCPNQGAVKVPGAEKQQADCLDDLTTKGTQTDGHTDRSDWNALHASATRNPPEVVPGLQIDGYFPDTSKSNGYKGWFRDSQFVIRFPNDWNGKLVVTGAPGVRRQYANDFIIGDFVLAKGYAFASTDKGNNGVAFYRDGAQPGDAVAEWHTRTTELTKAAKEAARLRYGKAPEETYMTGISNGGYLTRWQLEHEPALYDGGVDWEGTLMRPEAPNLFTYLPAALRHLPGLQTRRPKRPPGDVRGGLRARLRAAVGRPLRRVLGPHPAHLSVERLVKDAADSLEDPTSRSLRPSIKARFADETWLRPWVGWSATEQRHDGPDGLEHAVGQGSPDDEPGEDQSGRLPGRRG